MWPYVCIPITQNCTSYKKTLCQKRKPSLNFLQGQQSITKIILKTDDFNKYKKLLSVSI